MSENDADKDISIVTQVYTQVVKSAATGIRMWIVVD